jgi:DNA repair protein RadC
MDNSKEEVSSLNNIHINHRERLQQQIFLSNLNNMNEIQMLEYILTLSIPRIDTNPLSHKLLDEFGSLYNVLDADYSSLVRIKGVGKKTAMMLTSLRKIMYYYRESKRKEKNTVLDTPAKIIDFFKDFLESKLNEELYMVCLNGKSELIRVENLSSGDSNSLAISTRKISETALKYNSNMVIIGHNHPQGNPYPSFEDFNTTSKIVEALAIFNIPVIDHVIVGKNECYSFASAGTLTEIKNELMKSKRPEMASRIMNLLKQ